MQAQYQARIADLVFKNGSTKINSPSALARAAAFTHNNIFLQIAAKEYEAELHKRRISAAAITYPSLNKIEQAKRNRDQRQKEELERLRLQHRPCMDLWCWRFQFRSN